MTRPVKAEDGRYDISVIIPTYNRFSTIERALASVLEQTLLPSEIIVVDDGSNDGTRSLLEAIARQSQTVEIRYYYQDNAGVSAARNRGIEQSKFPWIALLDSDDAWLPEKLERQVRLLEEQQHLRFVHGEEIWIRHGKRVNQMKKHAKAGGFIYQRCLPLCAMSPSAAMMHRSVLEEVGMFREDFVVCEDYDLWLKITARMEVGFVADPIIVKYGGAHDQLSRQYVAMDYWRVRALDDALMSLPLDIEQQQLTKSMLLKKAKILMNGYRRHQNMKHYDEIAHLHAKWASRSGTDYLINSNFCQPQR